jgi:archaellum component FlaC
MDKVYQNAAKQFYEKQGLNAEEEFQKASKMRENDKKMQEIAEKLQEMQALNVMKSMLDEYDRMKKSLPEAQERLNKIKGELETTRAQISNIVFGINAVYSAVITDLEQLASGPAILTAATNLEGISTAFTKMRDAMAKMDPNALTTLNADGFVIGLGKKLLALRNELSSIGNEKLSDVTVAFEYFQDPGILSDYDDVPENMGKMATYFSGIDTGMTNMNKAMQDVEANVTEMIDFQKVHRNLMDMHTIVENFLSETKKFMTQAVIKDFLSWTGGVSKSDFTKVADGVKSLGEETIKIYNAMNEIVGKKSLRLNMAESGKLSIETPIEDIIASVEGWVVKIPHF